MPQKNEHGRPADISLKALLVAGSLSVLALWWAWPGLQSTQSLRAESSQLLHFDPHPLPDFQLEGVKAPLNPANLKGQWTILYFAYSRCSDDCRTTLGALGSFRRSMVATGQLHSLRFAVVSVAPDDDPQRMQDFVETFDSGFDGFAGPWNEREKLFLFFDNGIEGAFDRGTDQYLHSTQIFLIDPEANFVATWTHMPERSILHDEICGFINCSH